VYKRQLNPPLGIADPTSSTSNTRMYEIILQAYGWDEGWRLLTLMAANAYVYSASGDVRDAVIRGERIVGITIDFYGYTAHLKNPACVYIAPPGETIVNGDPIALFSTSTHPEEAQAFIAWVLTDGQKIWLDKDINRLPANPNVFNTPEGQQRQDLKHFFETVQNQSFINFNDSLALSYEFMMQQYFKATLVDQHDALQNAWKALVAAYLDGKISEDQFNALKKKLTDPVSFIDPLTGKNVTWTQDEAIRLDQAFLSGKTTILDELMKEWRDAAAAKYNEVLQELGG
jgi:ABC-type Fe3+ transport system substrate-binding protein